MSKIKRTTTIRIEASGDEFTVEEVSRFLVDVDPAAKIKVRQSSSYVGEQGVTPTYIEATWTE